jgi:hypothetical protein
MTDWIQTGKKKEPVLITQPKIFEIDYSKKGSTRSESRGKPINQSFDRKYLLSATQADSSGRKNVRKLN